MLEHPYRYVALERGNLSWSHFFYSGLEISEYYQQAPLNLGGDLVAVANYFKLVYGYTDHTPERAIEEVVERCVYSWYAVVLAKTLEGVTVGFGAMDEPDHIDDVLLDPAFVEEGHRRRGIYKELLRRRIEIAKRIGGNAVVITSSEAEIQVEYLKSQGFELYRPDHPDDVKYRKLI